MGQDVRIVFWCDIHGRQKEANRTSTVGFDGTWRDIELCTECEEQFLPVIARLMKAGRQPESVPQPSHARGMATPRRRALGGGLAEARERGRAQRAWAEARGHHIKPSGYIPKWVQDGWAAEQVVPEVSEVQSGAA